MMFSIDFDFAKFFLHFSSWSGFTCFLDKSIKPFSSSTFKTKTDKLLPSFSKEAGYFIAFSFLIVFTLHSYNGLAIILNLKGIYWVLLFSAFDKDSLISSIPLKLKQVIEKILLILKVSGIILFFICFINSFLISSDIDLSKFSKNELSPSKIDRKAS